LHAVGSLVAAIAIAALVLFVLRQRGFEVSARQIVEQDIEADAEEILPALGQMIKQRPLVGEHFVEAAIQRILLHQRIARTEQIAHGTLFKPQPVQAPFAAGIDQAVDHQRLQDVMPAGAFATIRQACLPKVIEPELLVQLTGQPASTPLSRSMQLYCVESYLDAIPLGVFGHLTLGGK